ncbi:MAG: ligand-gated channel protein [Alteromonadaceae bacterium]|jgi:outer membrane receptor protein involved in Fe transport|nr:ligand-gated channel protein [Alteromonadaceae bacterium]MBB18275.1 ligand-gated channel protein [Rickettsiales bacterium]
MFALSPLSHFIRNSLSITLVASTGVAAQVDVTQKQKTNDTSGLERIVVTSQKRMQSLQDIPTSIQAFSGEELAKNNIANLLDMSESLPNVHITETSSSKRVFVRGIGSGTNAGFEQSVAMYKDGIYLGRGHQAKFPFLDMERIELVKGPQAVMFGKNATAGALNMSSNPASSIFEGNVKVEIGSDNERRYSAVVNVPITDDLAVRIAAFDESRDGFLYNQVREQDEASSDSHGVRLTADWQVSDAVKAQFKWEHGNFSTSGSRYQYIIDTPSRDEQIASDPTNPGNVGYRSFLLSDTSGLDYTSAVSGDQHPGGLDEGNDTSTDNAVLNITYDVNDYEFTSISTYSQYDWDALFDADYSEVSLIRQEYIENYQQFTQEFRVASPTNQTIEYVAGVFYMSSELEHPNDVLLGASLLIPELPSTSLGTLAQFEQEQESYSAFTSATWNMDTNWKANLGLRYQHETKDVTSEQSVYALFEDGTPEAVQQFANAAAPAISRSLSGAGVHNLATDRSESHLSPSISLQYFGFTDTMLFANAGIGYKAGGFDGSGLNASQGTEIDPESGFEFEDEKATNYELGIKSEPIKNQLEVNATLFYTKYENLQVSEFNGNAFVVKNAAETAVKGVEVDARWVIADNWDLTANIALLDFEYQAYDGAAPTVRQSELLGQATQSLTGKTGAFAPDYSGNIALNYEANVFSGYTLSANLALNFTDEFFLEQDLDPLAHQNAYEKINLRIGLLDADDKWSLSLLVNNLTDKSTFSQANDVPVLSYAHRFLVERPRSVLLQAAFFF